jgi:hypothetical protein
MKLSVFITKAWEASVIGTADIRHDDSKKLIDIKIATYFRKICNTEKQLPLYVLSSFSNFHIEILNKSNSSV